MKRRAAVAALVVAVPLALGACGASGQVKAATHATGTGSGKVGGASSSPNNITLDGAGANSIDPFFQKVFYDYHQTYPRVTVNYSPAGSSVGISDIQQNTVAFGDSEIPMATKDLAKAKGPVLQVPVDLGGVAISYNVPGAPKNLKLAPSTLAGIFEGIITNWDSPLIAAVTGDNNLPNLRIVPVHRADSSGPGWDLDDYLIKNSSSWVSKIGTSAPSKTWPLSSVGIGEQLNSGVATYVAQSAGAIGFVEYGYALQAGFANAALQNSSGAFVSPTQSSIALAGTHATKLSSSNFDIVDGRRGYVPSRQFQLDVALPEASQRVHRGFVAAAVYLCHNGRPAPGGQVGLCTPSTERRLTRQIHVGRAGELGRQSTVRIGSGSGGNNRQFSHHRGAGHARAPRGGAK